MRAGAEGQMLVRWGVAARAYEGQEESGDLHVLAPFAGGCLAAVIDGLGHGAEARVAAATAARVLEAHADEQPVSLVERCHQALRKTRGAVMSLASLEERGSTLTWLGVGNVIGVLIRAQKSEWPRRDGIVLRSGVVGYQLPPLRASVLHVSAGDTVILASDGVRSDFEREVPDGLDPQATAEAILAGHARGTDDACVLVARYLGSARVALSVRDESDLTMVRKSARDLGRREHFPTNAAEAFVTAVSEVARNMVVHAGGGEVALSTIEEAGRRGLMAVARDIGPGIADPSQAMRDGYSTAGTLGLGLPSAQRLVDGFELESQPGRGTTIVLKKWRP